MHQYLKAIGFGNIESKKELYKILKETEKDFTHHELVFAEEEIDFCEYQKEYGAGLGVSLFGDIDIYECFKKQYYLPYFIGTGISSYADVAIEKKMDKEAYVGICEDEKIGISLIFHLQNVMEYLKELQITGNHATYASVTFSALCNEGTVLLPVRKDEVQEKKQKEEVKNRMMLVNAARSGDPAAIESLTLDDIDTYSKVSRRLIKEDIFSIVDTYIMPYGIECDRYSILGEILELGSTVNEYTGEEIYIMKMEVNDMTFDLCVPVRNVVGEPAPGRRFKGNIWLQGRVNF